MLHVHVMGPNAKEILVSACLAVDYQAGAEDIARTFHSCVSMLLSLLDIA